MGFLADYLKEKRIEFLEESWERAFALGYAKAVSDIKYRLTLSDKEIEKINQVVKEANELATDKDNNQAISEGPGI